jgi:paraquat-inducible protein A
MTAVGQTASSHLRACHDCDLLQEIPDLKTGEEARCPRCGYLLAYKRKDSLKRSMALAVTGIILFALTNIFPLLSLKSLGIYQESTLFSASVAMFDTGYYFLAIMIFLMTILFPLISLTMTFYVLFNLHQSHFNPHHISRIYRFLMSIDTWGMLEIFMLAALVAMVKLGDMAEIILGISMYAFGGLVLTMTMLSLSLNPDDIWQRVKACQH